MANVDTYSDSASLSTELSSTIWRPRYAIGLGGTPKTLGRTDTKDNRGKSSYGPRKGAGDLEMYIQQTLVDSFVHFFFNILQWVIMWFFLKKICHLMLNNIHKEYIRPMVNQHKEVYCMEMLLGMKMSNGPLSWNVLYSFLLVQWTW